MTTLKVIDFAERHREKLESEALAWRRSRGLLTIGDLAKAYRDSVAFEDGNSNGVEPRGEE